MSYDLSDLMQLAIAEDALGIHLHVGEPPVIELRAELAGVEGPPLEPADTAALLRTIGPPEELEKLEKHGRILFFHRFSEAIVFRVLVFRTNGLVSLELRIVNNYEDAA